MTRYCDGCGAPYEALAARSRWCSEKCRSHARRTGSASPSEQPPRLPGNVSALTRAALGDAVDTALGQMALLLALRIDTSSGGVGLVALVKEHRATLAAATRAPSSDVVDELLRRRTRRRSR